MLKSRVLEVFENYNGTLPTKIAEQNGISKETLRRAYLRGDLERPRRGIYVLPDRQEDKYFSFQSIYTKGVYSNLSALILHNMTTQISGKLYLTFPNSYYKDFKNTDVHAKFVAPERYDLGITEIETFEGNRVKVYNRERTLVDLLVYNDLHPYIIEEAFDDYFWDNPDVDKLYQYAKIFGVLEAVKEMEVKVA